MESFTYQIVTHTGTTIKHEITIDPRKTMQLFGIRPGILVKSETQGYGIVLGLIYEKLIFQFQDESKITYWSDCKTWEDHVYKGLMIVENTGNNVSEYLNNPKYSDITFIVGENKEEFYGHKMIISKIPWFDKLFSNNMKETRADKVILTHIEPLYFKIILEFIYTNCIPLVFPEKIDIIELYKICDTYMIDILKIYCGSIIKKNVCLDNYIDIWKFSETYDDEILQKYCFNYCLTNYHKLISNDEHIQKLYDSGYLPQILTKLKPQ